MCEVIKLNKKDKRNARIKQKTADVIRAYRDNNANTDPLGMYTGITCEVQSAVEGGKIYLPPESCIPQQDADDL